jgi:dolichol-phosphate mannosyltransferase
MSVRRQDVDVDVVLPVHNEAETIEPTIREILHELSPFARVRFVLSEDGSADGTKEVLSRLSKEISCHLMMSDARKGYSRAVRDAMQVVTAPYVLFLDSDGQCDPRDFPAFWQVRDEADILIGWRVHRADTFLRRWLSKIFGFAYKSIYRVPVHDPSCPFVLARREVVERLGVELGEMKEGFWWEFVARAFRRGFSIREIPIRHRVRAGGATRVYTFRKMPGIGIRHGIALFKIYHQTRSPRSCSLGVDVPRTRDGQA